MRRRYVLWLLAVPLLSGCTLALGGDECGEGAWTFGITANAPTSEPVAYCEPID